ncbi:MAG: hypothetical protein KKA73_08810 [Chloroflexi bacterium]|nr:hypothetical protein [Chloroflexota bacterium]MBU1747777.1 hypothetical protein [Chloroflexota bacterium]MBU1880357.1 hypothetical protein [Chloroflexota bacterium]
MSQVRVNGIRGVQVTDFLLNCTDREYQAWWPGTHLAFHTVEHHPSHVGNSVYMDEFVGQRRIKMMGIVTQVVPGKRIVWQMKKVVRLPVRLVLELEDDAAGATITHTIRAGFKGLGRLLDLFLRIYFSDEFARAMDEHAQTEFPRLRDVLDTRV